MNPRALLSFLRTPTGSLLGFGVILLFSFILVKGFSHPERGGTHSTAHARKPEKKEEKTQLIQTVEQAMVPFNPPPNPVGEKPGKKEKEPVKKENAPMFSPISLYSDTSSKEPKPLGNTYVPYGRLIPCELIVTVDSSSIQTPIIGLTTEGIYHDGQLIVPAGTEIHGTAQPDRMRERIASSGNWTLVWQTGEELSLTGIALDREKDPHGIDKWGITDGSAGLRGRVLKSDDMAEIKLFAATFLGAAASAMTEKESTFFGTQMASSLQNAPLKGAQDVLGVYAKQIYDTIQRDGFYVRVPAGKEFYLYVKQTIDRADATIGGTRLEAAETQENPSSATHLQSTQNFP